MEVISNLVDQKKFISQSGLPQNVVWRNMGIEKNSSGGWLKNMYKNSFFEAFWTMLTSQVG